MNYSFSQISILEELNKDSAVIYQLSFLGEIYFDKKEAYRFRFALVANYLGIREVILDRYSLPKELEGLEDEIVSYLKNMQKEGKLPQ